MGKLSWQKMDQVFNPRSVAIVGASPKVGRVGHSLVESLVYGNFKGEIYPVNPEGGAIFNLKVYKSLEEINKPIDLAIIGLNPRASLDILERCGKLRVKGAVCISGGFKEIGEAGKKLEDELIEIARKYRLIVVGPNTLGIINARANLNTSFYPMKFAKGDVSIVSQSGGFGFTLLYSMIDYKVGLNKWIGAGNRSVLEFCDYLEYLARDDTTKVIGVLLEGFEKVRPFLSLVRSLAGIKPVVALKIGNADSVRGSVLTHTGTMAGSHELWKVSYKQFGILPADGVFDMVCALKSLSLIGWDHRHSLEDLYILTHTAGPSIVAADVATAAGCHLSPPTDDCINGIKEVIGANAPVVIKNNPIDLAGSGFGRENFGRVAEIVLGDPKCDMLLAIYQLHHTWVPPTEELLAAKKKINKPIIVCYLGTEKDLSKNRAKLENHGIPVFTSPEIAARAAVHLIRYCKIAKNSLRGGEN